MLKIKVMNISKDELGKTLEKFEGTAWDQSPLFKMIYTNEYSMFGGEPLRLPGRRLRLRQRPKDVALLRNIAKVCGRGAHAVHRRAPRRPCSTWRAGRS